MPTSPRLARWTALLAPLLLLAACTAGDARFVAESANFWDGLWHGIIAPIAFVVGLFDGAVEIYERNNNGGWYDFGFLFGLMTLWGGGSHGARKRPRRPATRDDKEWEELGQKVERKIKRKIREWAEAEPDEAWNVVEAKAEAKLKRRVRAWAEEEEHEENAIDLGGPSARS
ncbi:MAG: hypothetical protein R3A79_16940 [Nannocystaceae bacterium]